MAVLLLAEHDNTRLSSATLSALTAALQLGPAVHLLVAGSACTAVVAAATHLAGVTRVLHADAPHYAAHTAENLTALVLPLAPDYTHIVAAATVHGKSLLPRIAALLDVAPVADVVRIIDAHTFVRPVHAGNALATVRCAEALCILSTRASAFAACTAAQPPAPVELIAAQADTGLARLQQRTLHQTDKPELATARVVVSGGRGLGSAAAFQTLLEPLAAKLGAAIGATRAAVDAGFVGNECQIGQTGRIVAPELYLAVGLSGAIQHMAGMQGSKVIVAINQDADAPICKQADYVLIADLNEAVPQLSAALHDKS